MRHYRREKLSGEIPEAMKPDQSIEEFEFKEMLNLIDGKYRLILIFYYLEGFTLPEIAELLELNINTVKTRLSRAREQIRTAYQEE